MILLACKDRMAIDRAARDKRKGWGLVLARVGAPVVVVDRT
jgi:hypothetical protein